MFYSMDVPQFVYHSSIETPELFPVLAIVYMASVNIQVQTCA